MPRPDSTKFGLLGALVVLCALITAGYAWYTAPPPPSDSALPPLTRPLTPLANVPIEPAGDADVTAQSVSAQSGPAQSLLAPSSAAQSLQAQSLPAPSLQAASNAGTEGAAVARIADSAPARTPVTGRVNGEPLPVHAHAEGAEADPSGPVFLLRHTAVDQSYGRLGVDWGTGRDNRQATELSCERVHFAGHRGACLEVRRRALTTYTAVLFDAALQPTARVPLNGIPSRTRVSPDGRYVAVTVFVAGHSYAGTDFSTETQILDSVTGAAVVANLEQMAVTSEGKPVTAADVNFWGVTFTRDSNRFYATLGTGGAAYLVEGDIRENRMRVLTEGVECPSLSPDNTRVAFKQRVPGPGLAKWRIAVLDLATLTETPVAESRFIDEQVEWLDDRHILYTQEAEDAPSPVVTDVWVVPADGSGRPERLLRSAASPTLFRRP